MRQQNFTDLKMLHGDWGNLSCTGTITSSGHISFDSDITKDVNSRPLSL